MRDDNPVIGADFPDPDVIRVGDAYYMVSTTMHFMPGAVILRSFDLVHWERFSHVYETLEDTPEHRLEGERDAYGRGMWAASLRLSGGVFHVCFVANDTGRTYLFRATDLAGPWTKSYIEGFYHDNSLLFDDDGRVYIVYGHGEIYLTELDSGLAGPLPGGRHRLLASDAPGRRLRYEGAHIYKVDGGYLLFLIHWPSDGTARRTQACLAAESLDGEFKGGDVLDDDLGFPNNGVAQGGIVDAPNGDRYAVLFQDRGAVGRIPVIVPLGWRDGRPVFPAAVPRRLALPSSRPDHAYAPIIGGDDFRYAPGPDGRIRLKDFWQWNHNPDAAAWTAEGGELVLTAAAVVPNLSRARNTLTQATVLPGCVAEVDLDGAALEEGDYAGIAALMGRYGLVALTRRGDAWFAVMLARPGEPSFKPGPAYDGAPGIERGRVPLAGPRVRLRARFDFPGETGSVEFAADSGSGWTKVGPPHPLRYGLDHFTGCRVGLFAFATSRGGGRARFRNFAYAAASAATADPAATV